MCGIFGSLNYRTFETLYRANRIRGNFAGGSMYVRRVDNDMHIKKWPGVQSDVSLTGDYAFTDQYDLYVGHTQSPTSSHRNYDTSTTHPFMSGDWIVAHNGVLENHEHLVQYYLSDLQGYKKPKIDSQVIPMLLDRLYVDNDADVLSEVFTSLKGTFACWVYHMKTKQLYIARSGSTLFMNKTSGSFSSVKTEQASTEVLPGHAYCITSEGVADVATFKCHSPFFTL